ncbi:MAG TPA: malonic semialdehyde reductase [Rhizomicrobium sp.]|jgi:3-hydroxypropanoate dehydrogenase|nr:malonic semialdehyde reductase [Rhizomicrobium sp.]
MTHAVNDEALDTIFRAARSQNKWLDKPVSRALLMALYDLMRFGPTSANCSPARIVFLVSRESKARLKPHLHDYNVEKVMTAPAVAVIGYDLDFPERMPKLFPHNPAARHWFDDPAVRATTAFRNGSLQGAYFIIAARALGLDCGPMSGFDNDGVDAEFFVGTRVKSNFLCGVGYGDPSGVFARNPRLDFDEACRIL